MRVSGCSAGRIGRTAILSGKIEVRRYLAGVLRWLKFANGGIAYNSSAKTQHGYTGHEQVDSMGLIHMNGRLYAPGMNRFIQADPMVQDATDPASWNRYAYVFNNPLAHTDPSGYWGVREQAGNRHRRGDRRTHQARKRQQFED